MDLVVPFITGLTTGGLSCLAVQGGLLASSIAHEVEQSVATQPGRTRKPAAKAAGQTSASAKTSAARHANKRGTPAAASQSRHAAPRGSEAAVGTHPRAARPIVLFLVAKLIAYTVLGFFLGLLGSVFQLTPMTRAVMQAAVGVFMVGTALRMFNVHPIFRYFALEPPHFVTRYIRRKSKGEASALTPIFLGVLTVLIPCGVTQAMMAVAIASGSPAAGAVTMFAFILGTSPVFFAVAYAATRLGSRWEAGFMKFVAVTVLILGLISIDSGLTLAGWPYSVSNLRLAMSNSGTVAQAAEVPAQASGQPAGARIYGEGKYAGPPSPGGAASGAQSAAAPAAANVVTISVQGNGYQPRVSHAKAGVPIQMALVTNNSGGCARAFVLPSLGIQQILPESGTTTFDVPAQPAGTKLYYSCAMGMYSGMIIFDA